MRIGNELQDARLNVRETATLVGVHEAHFRRQTRAGIFPAPKRTTKGQPYFDYPLLEQIAGIVRSKVGANGVEVMFYRRRQRANGGQRQGRRARRSRPASAGDTYVTILIDGLRQLGIDDDRLSPANVSAALRAEFGSERPAMEEALPAVARRLLGDQP